LNKPIPFGKYYLLERINVGGMAEVFKAKTVGVEGFERIVALKRILPSIAEDEEFITMFIDEAKIAVQLQHANIAQIFDLGKVDDSYFIALEYVNGRDLRGIFDDLHKMGQTMPMPQVCYLIMQLCEGLDYAHNKRDAQGRDLNLVHRDVSPQNLLIGYEGEVKLIDFGIAKAAGKASKTQAGILKGKFGYMSPEQVRGLPIDRRSDIFALGIVLYEMLTGERLFIGESDFSTLEKVRNVDIIPPSSFNASVPVNLERIVLKALEKNVEDRYQNAIDLHDDLQLFMHSVGQFSSRKDLSAWMKRTFPANSVEDNDAVELEEVEEIEEISTAAGSSMEAASPAAGAEDFGWDEEERETQIFDKDPREIDRAASGDGLLSEPADPTVAVAPSEALLAEMGEAFEMNVPTRPTGGPSGVQPSAASGLRRTNMGLGKDANATPAPVSPFPAFAPAGASPARNPGGLPSLPAGDARRSPFDLPKPAFRQTLIGGAPAPGLPAPNFPVVHPPPGPAYPTYQPPPNAFGSRLPAAPFSGPAFPGAPVLPQLSAPPSVVDFDAYVLPPLVARSPSRLKYYVAFLLFMLAGGGGAYMYMTRPGRLQVAVKPQDAKLAVDGVLITAGPPFQLEKRPGVYRLSVSRDGYVSRDEIVQISAGQAGHMDIELGPSSETGFDLTSQPSGGLVWLDGQPLAIDEHGKQATTNFHASRISPGPHVIEIRGNPLYQNWRQEFVQEPERTVRLHAGLVSVVGAGKTSTPSSPSSRGADHPAAQQPSPQPVPTPSPNQPSLPVAATPGKSQEKPRVEKRGAHRSASKGDDNLFEGTKPSAADMTDKKPKTGGGDEDIFESAGRSGGGDSGGTCTVTISSKPWAEVSIDGKPTGKITPLVNYAIPCGKHRLTFKNADLMIERNESVTFKAGQPFKKIFSLVENEL
jgi:serine/threonine protein kinase